jgi:hypothetical protein
MGSQNAPQVWVAENLGGWWGRCGWVARWGLFFVRQDQHRAKDSFQLCDSRDICAVRIACEPLPTVATEAELYESWLKQWESAAREHINKYVTIAVRPKTSSGIRDLVKLSKAANKGAWVPFCAVVVSF